MTNEMPTIHVQVDHDEQVIFITTDREDFDQFCMELQEAIECHFCTIPFHEVDEKDIN